MARIVYGLAGEGSGHSSRAREMAAHLVHRGHEVRLVSYDRGYRNLKDDFDVFETEGLNIASRDNKVSVVKTFTDNIKRLPEGHAKLRELRKTLFKEFRPDCVVTDFEPMTAYLANHYRLPLVSLDNQHRMRYVQYQCPPGMKADAKMTKTIIRAMVPRPDVSLVITFSFGKTKNDRTFLFPPIVRRAVRDLSPEKGGHILVYLTGGYETLLEELKRFGGESFVVYGYDRDEQDGPLRFRSFSQDGFLRDLATAKAVVATAGFTLISEALYLRKPYFALPMRGQFEQQLNGFELEILGYGKNSPDFSPDDMEDFLGRIPEFEQALAAYQAGDNSQIKRKLDELLTDDGKLAREFHDRRSS